MPRSIAEILAVVEDSTNAALVPVRIPVISQALRAEHVELDARLNKLRKQRDTIDISTEETETAARILEIEDQIESSVQEFKFQSIGYRAWQDLLREHPPTKEQLAANKLTDAANVLDYNVDTFPYEAMSASCVDPVMTVDEVKRLERSKWMTVGTWMTLWTGCMQANYTNAVPKKSLAAGLILHRNGESAATAVNTESPAASSSDE